jgi:hypothetical protein
MQGVNEMNEIVYPMTLDYVPEWNAWEVVRELASNALDADPGFRMYVNDDGALVVKSQGGQLAVRHLLFGVSEKEEPNAIGQFGEGLKLALLVLTRMELTVHIYSGGKHLWNEPAELEGERVFKIVWKNGVMSLLGLPVFACGKLQPVWQVSTYDASTYLRRLSIVTRLKHRHFRLVA